MNGQCYAQSTHPTKVLVNPRCAARFTQSDLRQLTKLKLGSLPQPSAGEKIYYNPKFFSQDGNLPAPTQQLNGAVIKGKILMNPNYIHTSCNWGALSSSSTTQIHVNRQFLDDNPPIYKQSGEFNLRVCSSSAPTQPAPNKYKLVRTKEELTAKTANLQPKPQSNLPLKSSSKYAIRRETPAPVVKLNRFSNPEFTKISSTKLIRKSTLINRIKMKRRAIAIAIAKYKLFQNINFRYKNNWTRNKLKKYNPKNFKYSSSSSQSGSFKSVGSTKSVRKSVLLKQIELRRLAKRPLYASFSKQKNLFKYVNSIFLKASPSKEKRYSTFKPKNSKNRCLNLKLKKNNKKCTFYNSFGRCKGKDKGTCKKIHDPLYVSVCKKLLAGECKDENCLLSHDVRPGKMPTCYHYLAGVCTRTDCPFLHIKVNPKAPICTSFLQGFCPDVFNCMKRHEYICPKFADNGSCTKGKSCVYPHKTPTYQSSKLLGDDQVPLTVREPEKPKGKRGNPVVSKKESTGKSCVGELVKSEVDLKISPVILEKELSENPPPLAFKRYFTVPLQSFASSVDCDSSVSTEQSFLMESCTDSENEIDS